MIKKIKESLYLRQLFFRILLFRLFIPLMLIVLIAALGVGYLSKQNLESHQTQVVESISHIVDYHIDHGRSILEAIAKVAENTEKKDLSIFMKSSWESYGYFETIYYLDKDNKINFMIPYSSRYEGMDMSKVTNIEGGGGRWNICISKPFISIRTGYPTVYLIRPLLTGGFVVGELNLGLFQEEINAATDNTGKDFVFIMDQSGTLIAHPSIDLVTQQTNMSNLGIFKNVLEGKTSDIYYYNGNTVIGSAVQLKETKWIVVDQVSIYEFINHYIFILAMLLIASLIIFTTLVLNLRKQLNQYVITPVEQLIKKTNALTIGDFSNLDFTASIPTAFAELDKLLVDFQFMMNTLEAREAELRESENRYRGLSNRMPIGLFRATLTGEILGTNPMFRFILGYPNSECILNRNIIEFISPFSIDNKLEEYSIENIKNLNNHEISIKRYDGKIIWIQIDSQIVYSVKGEAESFEGCIQDITERKNTEVKIKEQQELLFKSEKEKRETLEKTLVMKDEFISLISHEFKTPLNVIYSAIQLIECVYLDKIPERVQELIGNIKQNTFRQLRLSNNLLDVTKMNSGQFKLNMKYFDIVFLSKAIAESIEVYANQKNIELSFKSNVESKNIITDEEKFERILLNILSNAMKFTNSGGKIAVSVDENKSLDVIQIRVTDTGIGIPKDKQEIIFERFGQVDNNLSRQAEGSGIGLSLVKLLVNILEGTIEVESEVGVGSMFTITLPIKNEEVDENPEYCLDTQNELVSKIKVEFSDIYL